MALVILLLNLASCDLFITTDSETTTDTQTTTQIQEEQTVEPRKILLAKNGRSVFTVITEQEVSTEVTSVLQTFLSKLAKETGALIKTMDDATDDGNPEDSENEIIIGNCLRTDSQKALEGMSFNDYKITATEKNIVIASRSETAIIDAIWHFMALLKAENIVRDEEKNTVALIWKEDIYQADATQNISSFTIGGKSIKDFRIVYPASGSEGTLYKQFAEDFRALGVNIDERVEK